MGKRKNKCIQKGIILGNFNLVVALLVLFHSDCVHMDLEIIRAVSFSAEIEL